MGYRVGRFFFVIFDREFVLEKGHFQGEPLGDDFLLVVLEERGGRFSFGLRRSSG